MTRPTWVSDTPAPLPPRPRGLDWLRVLRRGLPMVAVTCGGLALLLALRLPEKALAGGRRPVTARLTRGVCRFNLMCLGLRLDIAGPPPDRHAALVANHASWLDILVLNAAQPVTFVSKAEVAGWPGIGLLARATGTLFIRRDRTEAAAQVALIAARIAAGDRLLFFPEGTSTDGQRVLPFKATLFQPLAAVTVQPVTVIYRAPDGQDARFYGWWGDMDLGPHLLAVLAVRRQGHVQVLRHAALPAEAGTGRKDRARAAEAAVRAGFSLPR